MKDTKKMQFEFDYDSVIRIDLKGKFLTILFNDFYVIRSLELYFDDFGQANILFEDLCWNLRNCKDEKKSSEKSFIRK